MDLTSDQFDFDFVISYAGENQSFADKLHQNLANAGARVFYAPEFQAELWGKNLFEYLGEIYSKNGRYCIPLVSKAYVEKHWTRHEWKSAQERALSSVNKEYPDC